MTQLHYLLNRPCAISNWCSGLVLLMDITEIVMRLDEPTSFFTLRLDTHSISDCVVNGRARIRPAIFNR